VSIREHCSWVGDDIDENTEKARRLILSALYGASHYVPLEEKVVDVTKSALIIGGGVSGLSAATFLSRMGMHVYLVEKEAELGGHVKSLKNVWPIGEDGSTIVADMVKDLESSENVEIFTSATIESFGGFFGNYEATLKTSAGETKITVGGVVVAIGFSPFDPKLKPELNYGNDERI
jgi:heterodisulfide reductase subunit A